MAHSSPGLLILALVSLLALYSGREANTSSINSITTRNRAICTSVASFFTLKGVPIGQNGDGTLRRELLITNWVNFGAPRIATHPHEMARTIGPYRCLKQLPATRDKPSDKRQDRWIDDERWWREARLLYTLTRKDEYNRAPCKTRNRSRVVFSEYS